MPGAEPRGARTRRIAMVIRLLGGRTGGAERLFCETASMLADAGYQVTVLCCDSSREPLPYPLSPAVELINLWRKRGAGERAIRAVAAGYPRIGALAPLDWLARNLPFVRELYAATRRLEPDVIISFLPPANTPALIAGWLAGARVISTNHSVPEHDFQSDQRWDQNPVDRLLRRWSLHAAARVHVLFPSYAAWFPPAIRDKTVAIPNYVSPAVLGSAAGGARRREVLAAGRLVASKGYATLIDAWAEVAARHPDWSLVIHGDGPERGALEAQIARLGLGDRIALRGHRPDIATAYREAELFCHPSHVEGFGLAAAEALACGLPVVAFSDCAGVRELVRDGDNGLLVERAGGAAALAAALSRLIADRTLREQLRARAPASVAAFSADAFRASWLAVLDDVLVK